ncbi:MAG TPA: DivIVA domain-containing protein [Acidimicrobiales bacterium]
MAETPAPIDPDRILEQQFTMVRRGLDPLEVQRYLLQVANQLRAAREREAELAHQLGQAEKRTAPIDELDPGQLARLLGDETARVLEAAQAASTEIRGKAEENVARLLREARDESQQMRDDADSVLTRKTAEAEEVASGIRSDAETELEKARSEAADLVEAGRQEGRDMVGEAQKVRQRMLEDLARRRKLLRQQIEQLQAGRDRLLSAYDVVRETLDVATEELHIALPEAKLAAETASLRAGEDEDEILEAEIASASAAVATEAKAEPVDADAETDELSGAADGDSATVADEEGGAEAEGEPADAALGTDEPHAEGAEGPDSLAPDPVEGRHSSSVKVVRSGEGDKAADVFARLRQQDPDADETEDETGTETPDGPDEAAEAAEAEPGVAAEPEPVVAELDEVEVVSEPEPEAVAEEGEPEGPPDPAAELVARRDAATTALEKNLARRIKRELSDEQNEVLASLASAKGNPKADDVLPAPEDHVARYQSLAVPSLAAAATAGADLVSTIAGPAAAPTTVADLADELAAELVAPLRERLDRAFADGSDPDDVAQSIRSSYREWKGQRVDQIAAHAVVAACNRGLLDRLPEGTLVRWVVAEGDTASPDCEDNALAGAVVRGEAFPTGHIVPPLHATCRCLVVPVDVDAS